MTKSLKSKLIFSYLAVAMITVLVISVLVRLNSSQSLMNLVSEQQTAILEEEVQKYFESQNTLDGFYGYYLQVGQYNDPQSTSESNVPPPLSHEFRGIDGVVDTHYKALIPIFGYEVGQTLPEQRLKDAIPVKVDGDTIAWILPDKKHQFSLNPQEELFLRRTTLAIDLAALAGVIVAVGMGIFLANGIVKPIRRLTKASKLLAQGDLKQQVPVTSKDELGQLTSTFNQMSDDLAKADEQRKRLTADITHDLSTPLQVIAGYMEMLEDNEVTLSPERIEVIKAEIEHLRRLVGDLTTLTQVEAKTLEMQLQPLSPVALLRHVQQIYEPIASRKGITLVMDAAKEIPEINVDEGRMQQVLKNLIENALRYTPAGGKITLNATSNIDLVDMTVADNGAGIEADDLPFVFDRFYQADKSRGSNRGKMGLGLAICKALVLSQNGKIAAESEGKGKGTTIRITFPQL
jgi:two-component system, OmpR family, sensor histidine kinase BaeS